MNGGQPRTFEEHRVEERTVHVAPGVEGEQLEYLTTLLAHTHRLLTRGLSVEAPLPHIFLHASAAQLREHACVPEAAVGYYDGAIHIAVLESLSELKRSLRHEYAHHVLASQGIGRPVWFHEGFAMSFASDEPLDAYRTWRHHPVDLAQIVEPLSSDCSDEEVQVFYAQAAVMYEFLKRRI